MNDTAIHLNDKNGDVNLENLYPALVECFTIILCGYAAGRLNLISQQECKGLNIFVSTFSLPSLIFLSLAQLDLSSVNWMFLASILLAKSIVFFGVLIITFCISRPVHYGKPGIYAVFCTQSNDFAIGYPILTALYSRSHPDYPAYLYLMAPVSLAILNPIAFVLMELGKRQEATEAKNKNIEILNKEDIAESNLQTSDFSERFIQRETVDSDVDMLTENHTETNIGNHKKVERDFNMDKRKAQIKFCGTIFKSIFSNPIVFMTALGLIGNFFFKYITFIGGILEVFGSAFSATALFVLGLRMVGTVQKLKGGALLVPGILIIIKLLVLPLVTREVVSLLQPGSNASETLDLSTFGFLYGTFPTAPAVFVFSSQYNLETELISSSMVACTFISAPLMFISARMTSLDNTAPENHFRELQSYGCDLGIIGIILGVWLIFLFIMNKSYTKLPHKITGFLIISQMIICIGVLLEPLTVNSKSWTLYVQFAVVAFGVYSSRIWSCFLAITLVLLQSRSLCFVIKLLPIFIIVGWGLPVILVAVVCIAASPDYSMGSLVNPNFQYGSLQAAVTLFILLVTFVVTSGCLILQQRYRRRYARYLLLVQEVNSKDLQEVPGGENGDVNRQPTPSSSRVRLQQVVDIEEIVSENGSKEYVGCENRGELCSSKFHCTEAQREACELNVKEYNEHITSEEIDPDAGHDLQIMGHVVLLLLIVTSLFVGIMLSIWTLVVNDVLSGIYVELAFLDVTLNVGQICFTFAVFGLEVRTILCPLINLWRRCIYGADTIFLTPVEELSFETTHVCHQFIAHHLRKCEKDIAKDIRVRLTLHKDCFKGKSLVTWLQEKRLAKDTAEAVQYASHLLEGRVIRHVENRHHFVNSNLLYTFKSL